MWQRPSRLTTLRWLPTRFIICSSLVTSASAPRNAAPVSVARSTFTATSDPRHRALYTMPYDPCPACFSSLTSLGLMAVTPAAAAAVLTSSALTPSLPTSRDSESTARLNRRFCTTLSPISLRSSSSRSVTSASSRTPSAVKPSFSPPSRNASSHWPRSSTPSSSSSSPSPSSPASDSLPTDSDAPASTSAAALVARSRASRSRRSRDSRHPAWIFVAAISSPPTRARTTVRACGNGGADVHCPVPLSSSAGVNSACDGFAM
mmetsp:Transcript_6030/g.21470  ORF Transcript_6030/g.21470 Transcript_6030/m.21470 type:complete len:262 (+) Transcript_6030:1339-2124(+)